MAAPLKATALFWDSSAVMRRSHALSPKSRRLGRTPLSSAASISISRMSASGLESASHALGDSSAAAMASMAATALRSSLRRSLCRSICTYLSCQSSPATSSWSTRMVRPLLMVFSFTDSPE